MTSYRIVPQNLICPSICDHKSYPTYFSHASIILDVTVITSFSCNSNLQLELSRAQNPQRIAWH